MPRLAVPDLRQPFREAVGVVDAEIQPHAAERVVDVRGVAREQHAPGAVALGHALMHRVEIGVYDPGAAALRHEAGEPVRCATEVEQGCFVLGRIGREHAAPQPAAVRPGHLEGGRPLDRVHRVVAVGEAERLEVEGGRDDQEAFGPGEAAEVDALRLAHDAAAAVGADQPGAAQRACGAAG